MFWNDCCCLRRFAPQLQAHAVRPSGAGQLAMAYAVSVLKHKCLRCLEFIFRINPFSVYNQKDLLVPFL